MLQLKNITKDYVTSSETVAALRGVTLSFRKREFVSILGPSGCGKTTLLNIIGGLDSYTDGDLVINGTSTKQYRDRDWDAYRNHSIGFVFQSYNLIPHQTVLQNVELALTLSGVSKSERRARAKAALEEVGLGDQLNKRPSEMSGGQMQRVAIARALVNDPDIILADEPTGALDTKTSVQIMEILKRISEKRLIIMVTHNPELADKYSSRIIRMLDGRLVDDSAPFDEASYAAEAAASADAVPAEAKKRRAPKQKKPSMSFFTAFMLSLKNLFTKKGRTALTAFAGSIGIIGISLILAVSEGTTAYINHVQETTLSAYPLTLESTSIDVSSLIESFLGAGKGSEHENDAVYKDPLIGDLVNALSKIEANENDLAAFKLYLEEELAKDDSPLKDAISGIQYAYDLNISIYTKNQDGNIIKSDAGELMSEMLGEFMLKAAANAGMGGTSSGGTTGTGTTTSSTLMSSMMSVTTWEELLPGVADANGDRALINDILTQQYDVVAGKWPSAKDEIVLVLNENNELDDLTLYALGLLSEAEIDAIIDSAVNGTELPESNSRWSYEEILALRFKTIFPYDCYMANGDGTFRDISKNALMLDGLYNNAMELRVVGIIRPSEEAETTMLNGSIGYTYELTEYVIEKAQESEVVKAQLANPTYDVITGLPFKSSMGSLTEAEKAAAFRTYIDNLSNAEKANAYVELCCLMAENERLEAGVDGVLAGFESKEQLIEMIVATLKQEDPSIDTTQVGAYFENMTLDELKSLIRSTVEDAVREQIDASVAASLAAVPEEQKLLLLAKAIDEATEAELATYYDEITEFSGSTLENNLSDMGCVYLDTPSKINLFASTFESKDVIVDAIAKYNDGVNEEQKIAYTDLLGIMMSSITTIINAITYVLIAFVAISLIVSSIMIGVITLISVQERTKEIGILRAIGASKRDVSGMFNAETMIIGLASGLLGVGVTYLLCIPINLILHALTGIPNLSAVLPISAAGILVLISVLLTLISGLIPSRSAAKKDPVVALRTE